jgi:hypothetical protein
MGVIDCCWFLLLEVHREIFTTTVIEWIAMVYVGQPLSAVSLQMLRGRGDLR